MECEEILEAAESFEKLAKKLDPKEKLSPQALKKLKEKQKAKALKEKEDKQKAKNKKFKIKKSYASKKYPEQVEKFVLALIENAKTNDRWAIPNLEGGKCFAETIPYVEQEKNGRVIISDNYERFFNTIYTYYPDGVWTVRGMYSDRPERPYSFEQAMSDASIMFTG